MRRFLLVLTFISVAGWSQATPQQAQPPIVVQVQMPPTPRHYLQEFGPFIAALVAVGVALMQRHLQKQQLKQNLFDKRFEVYLEVRRFLSLALDAHNKNDCILNDKADLNIRSAKFLFGSDVSEYVGDIMKHIAYEEDAEGNVTRRVGWEDDDPFTLIMRWGLKAEQVFRPYLQLHLDQNWFQRAVTRTDRWMDNFDKVLASRYKG